MRTDRDGKWLEDFTDSLESEGMPRIPGMYLVCILLIIVSPRDEMSVTCKRGNRRTPQGSMKVAEVAVDSR